jgi:hypothetical protein
VEAEAAKHFPVYILGVSLNYVIIMFLLSQVTQIHLECLSAAFSIASDQVY